MFLSECMYDRVCCEEIFSDENSFRLVFEDFSDLIFDPGFPFLFLHGHFGVDSLDFQFRKGWEIYVDDLCCL